MVNYARQLERMARAADDDGEGLGKYVAREVELSMLSGTDKQTRAMLRQCLPHLARAVERCCITTMPMTKQGLRRDYGLTLKPGETFIAAANRRHACAVTLQERPDEQALPDLSGFRPAALWHGVSMVIDANDNDRLAAVLLAKMGASERRNLFVTADKLRENRASMVMAVVCVAASQDPWSAGGMWILLLQAIPVLHEETV